MFDQRPEEELPVELAAVQAALRGLTPQAGRIDRDRLMYLAGRASSVPHRAIRINVWPWSTAALLLLSLTLGGLLLNSNHDRSSQRLYLASGEPSAAEQAMWQSVNWSRSDSESGDRAAAGQHYLQLRTIALAQGVEALPASGGYSSRKSESSSVMQWNQLLKTEVRNQ